MTALPRSSEQLGVETVKKLMAVGRSVSYRTGTTLFHEGEPGDSLLVVEKGLLRIVRYAASGRSSILAFVGQDEVVGEVACLGQLPRTASVECITEVTARLLSRADVLALVQSDFDVCRDFFRVLCSRVHSTDGMAHRAGAQNMRSRLADAILMLAQQHGTEDEAGLWISLPLTRSEFGAYAGLSRENVSRIFSEWRRDRLVNFSDNERELLIIDIDALEKMSLEG